MDEELGTYFFDQNNKLIAEYDKLLNIPLYKGMKITITGQINEFQVVDWNYHHGHPDEKAGLRIILKTVNKKVPPGIA